MARRWGTRAARLSKIARHNLKEISKHGGCREKIYPTRSYFSISIPCQFKGLVSVVHFSSFFLCCSSMRSPSPAARGGAAKALQSTTIKAGVHFHHKISMKTFNSHRGWPRELNRQCWYTMMDFQAMRDESLQLIKSPGADWEGLLAQGLEAPQRYRTRREIIKTPNWWY